MVTLVGSMIIMVIKTRDRGTKHSTSTLGLMELTIAMFRHRRGGMRR